MRTARAATGWWLGACLLLAFGIARTWPFVADDALISLRYSERLLEGRGLVWNDGERVEGYSNLLWVLLCAALGKGGLDLVVAARALGVACSLGTLALLARRFAGARAAAGAAAMLAATGAFGVWSIGGLEGPLFTLCWTATLLQLERVLADGDAGALRAALRAGIAAALGCLTRPDGVLLAAVGGAVLLGARGRAGCSARGRREFTAFAAPVVLVVILQLAFRLAYYGAWLPNTAAVKLHASWSLFGDGLRYVGGGLLACAGIALPAAFGIAAAARRSRANAALLLGGVLAWCGYVAAVGGDFFPAWRLLVPVLAPLAIACGHLLTALAGHARSARAVALAATACGVVAGMLDGHTQLAAREVWEHDGRAIGEALRRAFAAQRPLALVDAAGAVPFWSGLPCVDMYGLCDVRPPAALGDAAADSPTVPPSAMAAAHHRSSAAWLLARAPDLALFGPPPGAPLPDDAAGRALVDDARWVASWRCVLWCAAARAWSVETADAPQELLAPLWVRVDGRAGIERSSDRIAVPAWLLGAVSMQSGFRLERPTDAAAVPRWQAQLDRCLAWSQGGIVAVADDHAACAEVRRPGRYQLDGVEVPAGRWQLVLEPALRGCTVQLSRDGVAVLVADGEVVTAGGPHAVALEVAADSALPLRIRTVALLRR